MVSVKILPFLPGKVKKNQPKSQDENRKRGLKTSLPGQKARMKSLDRGPFSLT
jgi:hypothetical protein